MFGGVWHKKRSFFFAVGQPASERASERARLTEEMAAELAQLAAARAQLQDNYLTADAAADEGELKAERRRLQQKIGELEQWQSLYLVIAACHKQDHRALRRMLEDESLRDEILEKCGEDEQRTRELLHDTSGGGDGGPLTIAVANGDVNCLRLLLDADFDPSWEDACMCWAAGSGDFELIELLVHAGAPLGPDWDDMNACMVASDHGDDKTLAFLIDNYSDSLEDALDMAETYGLDEYVYWQTKGKYAAEKRLRRCWLTIRGCARAVPKMRQLRARAAERVYAPDGQGYQKVASNTLVGKENYAKKMLQIGSSVKSEVSEE